MFRKKTINVVASPIPVKMAQKQNIQSGICEIVYIHYGFTVTGRFLNIKIQFRLTDPKTYGHLQILL